MQQFPHFPREKVCFKKEGTTSGTFFDCHVNVNLKWKIFPNIVPV